MERSFLVLLVLSTVFFSCADAQTPGCTDPLATNYNSSATVNNGTCTYTSATVSPTNPNVLDDTIQETSGLLWWDDKLWTHVDNTDTRIYSIDTTTGQITGSKDIIGVTNYDWEEMTQDDNYIYIGDFGNNGNGNRQDMHILRITKSAAGGATLLADTIWFHYQDQTDFSGTGNNNTNFDCEAFIATNDSLYLFTKQWLNGKTKLYALPKQPGNYAAMLKDSLDVQGLITGAHCQPNRRTIVLSGYNLSSSLLTPFVYLLYDFQGNKFFNGNKRKITVNSPIHQVEAISTRNGLTYFITNERLNVSSINITPKLQKINLVPYLSGYYSSVSYVGQTINETSVSLFPNPVRGVATLSVSMSKASRAVIQVVDAGGKLVLKQTEQLKAGENVIELRLDKISSGIYTATIIVDGSSISRKLVYETQ